MPVSQKYAKAISHAVRESNSEWIDIMQRSRPDRKCPTSKVDESKQISAAKTLGPVAFTGVLIVMGALVHLLLMSRRQDSDKEEPDGIHHESHDPTAGTHERATMATIQSGFETLLQRHIQNTRSMSLMETHIGVPSAYAPQFGECALKNTGQSCS